MDQVALGLPLSLLSSWRNLLQGQEEEPSVWEGRTIVEAADETFGEAGKVGVWTKADSITYFDGLTATALR